MRDNFESGWPRSEGAWRAKRLSDKVNMAKISLIYHIKILSKLLSYYIV